MSIVRTFSGSDTRLSEGRWLAFYITAHFSQEDRPYDWQVRFINHLCIVLMQCPWQADALAFQGMFYLEALQT